MGETTKEQALSWLDWIVDKEGQTEVSKRLREYILRKPEKHPDAQPAPDVKLALSWLHTLCRAVQLGEKWEPIAARCFITKALEAKQPTTREAYLEARIKELDAALDTIHDHVLPGEAVSDDPQEAKARIIEALEAKQSEPSVVIDELREKARRGEESADAWAKIAGELSKKLTEAEGKLADLKVQRDNAEHVVEPSAEMTREEFEAAVREVWPGAVINDETNILGEIIALSVWEVEDYGERSNYVDCWHSDPQTRYRMALAAVRASKEA
jgi:hypothetical protein